MIGAREYLAKIVPWPQNGDGSFVDVCWTVPNKNGGKPYWTGRAVRDLDEAVRTLNWAKGLPDTLDIYVCMSRQKTAIERVSQKGNKYLTPARSGENALDLKSIFLDVDIKKGPNGYPSQDEALKELARFIKETGLPKPSTVVLSGGGMHVYWTMAQALTPEEWQPLANSLAEATRQHNLRCDASCTVDSARVLRVPDTLNYKTSPPRAVGCPYALNFDYAAERLASVLSKYKIAAKPVTPQVTLPPPTAEYLAKFAGTDENTLGAGIEPQSPPIKLDDVAKECAFVRDAIATGGLAYTQPMWNLTTLLATFTEGERADAHRMASQHPGYTKESTDELYGRKLRERNQKDIGWPSCQAISTAGCGTCQACPHLTEGKTPFHHADRAAPSEPPTALAAERGEPITFADPWAEFVGPPFPLSILPPPLANFVDAEHRAMGADPSAIAMAALTAVAGALHAETHARVGDGWVEKPILWTALLGTPSAMKSPIILKAISPHRKIDQHRDAAWRQQYGTWKQSKATGNTNPSPAKPARMLIQDATAEKAAEILSRDTAGALMVHDELAGWLGGFDRYNSGQSARAFHLSCWNGGLFLRDRVGQGARDDHAEIRVDNLALSILGGIQPERLAALRDLTSDGLLQRFLPVLIAPSPRRLRRGWRVRWFYG